MRIIIIIKLLGEKKIICYFYLQPCLNGKRKQLRSRRRNKFEIEIHILCKHVRKYQVKK